LSGIFEQDKKIGLPIVDKNAWPTNILQ